MTLAAGASSRLQIHDPRERAIVSAADLLLTAGSAVTSPLRRRRRPDNPTRILLLRLERIGDLLMALPAIADVRALAPDAAIDLVVGSWNLPLARAIASVSTVTTLDAAWLAREGGGLGVPALIRAARRWRGRRYDLAFNFEPDLRSNLLVAACGARWTAGYRSGGGGPLLDAALDYDPELHTADNARRLVAAVFGRTAPPPEARLLALPEDARAAAARRLAVRTPLAGLHVSGGRAVKQWEPERFAEVAQRLAYAGATFVLTGAPAPRPLVDAVRRRHPADRVIDVAGEVDLLALASLLERLDVMITGDTGPMHLAAAVGTPVVAIFGPSDPVRYAPRGATDRVIRIDLPCSPCNRIRRPPARCVGHTPDCLAGVEADRVFDAAVAILDRARRLPPGATP